MRDYLECSLDRTVLHLTENQNEAQKLVEDTGKVVNLNNQSIAIIDFEKEKRSTHTTNGILSTLLC